MRALALAALLALVPALAKAEPYIGLFAGTQVLDNTITVDGLKLVDQGGDTLQGGIRAGWQTTLPGLSLGAEVEAFLASGRSRAYIPSERSTTGQPEVYSRSIQGGLGAFGRVGWRTEGNSAYFFRAGVLALSTNHGWDTLPAVGIGTEVPFGAGWSARLDAGYAWGAGEVYSFTAGFIYRF